MSGSNSTSSVESDAAELSETVKLLTLINIVFFPIFMFACQWLLHQHSTDRLMRKRSMTMIRVASLVPGWLAWFNLIISMEVGVPCFVFYIFALLIAPLSIGPQLTRAITLWSMFKLSHLVLSTEVLSVKRTTSKRHTKHREGTSVSANSNSETSNAVKSAIEVTMIKRVTRLAINITIWGLLVFPTTLLLIFSMALSNVDELMEEEFPKCFPEPIVVRYFSPANGLFVASLAITATCVLRNSSDELGIRREITRNVIIWAVTYVAVLFVRSFDLGRLQPIMISVQQMALTYSMIVLPCGGFCGMLGGVQVFSGEGSSYRQSSGSPSYRSSASSERSVAGIDFESGLDVVLSSEGGIRKFAEHCAREFSVENIRFWQAVNQYREICNSETAEDMKETAVHIYEEYVKPGSEFQVNLPMTMAKQIKKDIDTDNVTVELLDKGQLEIFNLMERDSYQRFLQSRAQKTRRASTAGVKGRRRKSLSS